MSNIHGAMNIIDKPHAQFAKKQSPTNKAAKEKQRKLKKQTQTSAALKNFTAAKEDTHSYIREVMLHYSAERSKPRKKTGSQKKSSERCTKQSECYLLID